MTIKELIALLEKLNPDLPIQVSDFSGTTNLNRNMIDVSERALTIDITEG